MGGEVAYIDAEHAMDPTYAQALGVDINSMLISQPDTGEQGLEITEQLVRSGAVDLVVVDSVAALVPVSYTHLILESVWGRDYYGEVKIVDVNIRRLRLKVEDDPTNPTYITTVWGYGYKWGF